jgi:2,4-diketo-3-deoxy-L-fuconate hydrolase
MKLLRYGPTGLEKSGLLDEHGQIRDLSTVLGELRNEHLAPAELEKIRSIVVGNLPVVSGSPRIGTPYAGIGKFIAIGLNYKDHAAEANLPLPTEPIIFSKATSCIVGPNEDVMLPNGSLKTDWEVELGVVIGSTARYVSEDRALNHVAGYCVVNDVSEREYQLERGGTWDKGKAVTPLDPLDRISSRLTR